MRGEYKDTKKQILILLVTLLELSRNNGIYLGRY